MPITTMWRGIVTDPETARYLTAVAAEVTRMAKAAGVPDFTVTPIPGCGSYQTSTAASAGTHAGGGAVDINCEGLTDAQARVLESAARKWGGTAWFRPRTSPTGYVYGWQRHTHILRTDCGDLAPAAVAQVGMYRRGLDGLADYGPDTGNRSWVGVAWGAVKGVVDAVNNVGATVAAASTPAHAAPPPPPAARAAAKGDAMSQTEIVGGSPWREIPIPDDGRTYAVSLCFGDGPQTAGVEFLAFERRPSVTTPSQVSRSGSWPAWQRDVPGRITLKPGEGAISVRFSGTTDQTLTVVLYPVS